MQRSRALPWVGTVALLAACSGEVASDASPPDIGSPVSQATLGPVSATVRIAPAEPRFGERVRLDLEIVAGAGAALDEPEIGARLGHLRVRGHELDGSAATGRLHYAITAEPERTGTNICRLPAIVFRVTSGEGAGTERELELPPFEVEIAGLAPDQTPDLADLGAPLGAIPLPANRDGGRAAWIAGLAALVVLAGGAVWWWRRGRGAVVVAPVLDPAEEAARAFDALLARGLDAQGRFAELYVGLTGIVRRYVERTTGIHAPEQTTEEFLRAAEADVAFAPEQRRGLTAFLEAADLVKFAAQVPTAREIGEAVAAGRSFCGLAARGPEVAA